jgi:hypothetical protein
VKAVLLAGVALNWCGAVLMTLEVRAGAVNARSGEAPGDYEQLKLFAAGTAAVFGAMYLFLFFEPHYVVPFLTFGAALKTWAFVLSALLRWLGRLGRQAFLLFGVSNLVVAVLFWIYIAIEAG